MKWTFYDPAGFIAEQGVLDFEKSKNLDLKSDKKLLVEENKDAYLIHQGLITYTISKINGLISSVKKNGETILENGPEFTIVPMNKEDGGKNDIAGETYQRNIQPLQNFPWYAKYAKNFDIVKESDSLFVSTDIIFKEGKGKVTYVFYSDGRFETRYKISDISQTLTPYQYGLRIVLPKSFDQLTWKREGDFSLYPDDHIGRNEGKAVMNATQTTGVVPWRKKPEHSWKDDANELGSNDFRSTKRNIIKASLSKDSQTKVSVMSNTKQASRSWLQEEFTHWLIADYTNNGSEPFYGTPHSSGRIKLDNESVLEGVLTLIIQQ
ncbi:hypothetical protein LZ575_09535 [Antarcticibacterium sp. 1MA-6-2]|uniref:hypothetical protein n=1 Tax=Antarcticibacterium sp. 1MA-6-2 TaxID=2908210 RepID=UPI001F25451A|nr:hypothetical protein [Antarcticibacterium sp. 1MA-6-2]UJH92677.1 hypothetical protein LZ575_09535 [Antarcticibacterium sp. 1MA-6-2]